MKKTVLALCLCVTANLAVGCGAKEDDEPAKPVVTKKDGGTPVVGAALSATTPVKNCPAYPTVADMDKLFVKSCGVDTFCHAGKIPYGDLKTGDIWNRMKDIKPSLACADGKMVDSQNVANSILLLKIKQDVPACPPMTGKDPGTIMPPLMKDQTASKTKVPPLTPAEIACFEGFVNAVAGK